MVLARGDLPGRIAEFEGDVSGRDAFERETRCDVTFIMFGDAMCAQHRPFKLPRSPFSKVERIANFAHFHDGFQ
jgi:hypothetical protein